MRAPYEVWAAFLARSTDAPQEASDEPQGGLTVPITFAEAKAIVRAAEEADWDLGTYQIEDEGFEDATHWLVVRGAAEAGTDPNYVIVGDVVPLVSKATGEITYIVPHMEFDRLDAMTPVCS